MADSPASVLRRIDALAERERVLVLCAAVALLYAFAHAVLFEPLAQARARLAAEVLTQREAHVRAQAEVQAIITRAQVDPNAADRAAIAARRQRLRQLDEKITSATAQLIAPNQVAVVLESVLRRSTGLAIVAVQGLGAEPLFPPDPAVAGAKPAPATGPYKHGVRILFTGGYLDTLAYLRAIEALPWRFFWDSIEFEVEDYPTASASIVVYTLSVDERWIGV
jgi:MSHA biogenesis protein MshJ